MGLTGDIIAAAQELVGSNDRVSIKVVAQLLAAEGLVADARTAFVKEKGEGLHVQFAQAAIAHLEQVVECANLEKP